MVSVAVLGPVRAYRDGLAAALRQHPDVHVVALLTGPDEAWLPPTSDPADVILADGSTDAGIAAITALAAPPAPVLVIAPEVPARGVVACARAGVSGFVHRGAAISEVVAAVIAVARGETICPPTIAAVLLECFGAAGSRLHGYDLTRLTTRERQILDLIDQGMSNKEIATALYIELSTVKNHVHSILEKLGARRRSEAAARIRHPRPRSTRTEVGCPPGVAAPPMR